MRLARVDLVDAGQERVDLRVGVGPGVAHVVGVPHTRPLVVDEHQRQRLAPDVAGRVEPDEVVVVERRLGAVSEGTVRVGRRGHVSGASPGGAGLGAAPIVKVSR